MMDANTWNVHYTIYDNGKILHWATVIGNQQRVKSKQLTLCVLVNYIYIGLSLYG